jgi:cytochrome c oxidase subunit 3
MTNIIRSNFQAHPFHLVSPSPWPIFISINLLTLTTTGVLSMHGFSYAPKFFFTTLFLLVYSMSL